MSDLERFGVSMPADLLDEFDRAIEDAGYANRSEAMRDLARKYLTERRWALAEGEVVGTITLIYDHHVPDLGGRLTQMQHDAAATVICTTHVHLDHHNCAEVILVRGEAAEVRGLADRLIATRGVKHGELTCTAAQP